MTDSWNVTYRLRRCRTNQTGRRRTCMVFLARSRSCWGSCKRRLEMSARCVCKASRFYCILHLSVAIRVWGGATAAAVASPAKTSATAEMIAVLKSMMIVDCSDGSKLLTWYDREIVHVDVGANVPLYTFRISTMLFLNYVRHAPVILPT